MFGDSVAPLQGADVFVGLIQGRRQSAGPWLTYAAPSALVEHALLVASVVTQEVFGF